tara:strand:+ start:76 stop:423 length:348 start_codon:yes stop_codon:yes gene_type:complete
MGLFFYISGMSIQDEYDEALQNYLNASDRYKRRERIKILNELMVKLKAEKKSNLKPPSERDNKLEKENVLLKKENVLLKKELEKKDLESGEKPTFLKLFIVITIVFYLTYLAFNL